MSEILQKVIRIFLMVAVFVAGIVLVIFGHRNIGAVGLLTMLGGLVCLVGLLWYYNRKYK